MEGDTRNMKQNYILEALWNDEIRINNKNSVTNHTLKEKTLFLRQRLADTITDQQNKILEDYEAACDELYTECNQNTFLTGFRLGAKIILSIFDE